jgi:hypothetical protein
VTVERAEKLASERIYGQKFDIWDVQASNGRWWVVTNPTNLYSHGDFPSMHTVFAPCRTVHAMSPTAPRGARRRVYRRAISVASRPFGDGGALRSAPPGL